MTDENNLFLMCIMCAWRARGEIPNMGKTRGKQCGGWACILEEGENRTTVGKGRGVRGWNGGGRGKHAGVEGQGKVGKYWNTG